MPIGVLVAQLGTPDAPTAKAVRTYLAQFLSDMRVIDYSPLIWQPILRGIILRVRPAKSAALYQRIWLDEGSPLLVYSEQQAEAIQARLGDNYVVKLGMRYGNPSIPSVMQAFEDEGIDKIIILPMFPQYSSTTTASIYDAVNQAASGNTSSLTHDRKRYIPTLRFIAPYFAHPMYIDAMTQHLTQEIANMDTPPDHYIISFHGIPKRYVTTGDPYAEQCHITADLLAQKMGWQDNNWRITFQSRFGPEKWLEPATDDALEHLHQEGIHRPFIFSPGFTTDCLETLDELGNEGREQFEDGGGDGECYHFAPCLNDNALFMDGLATLIQDNAWGWV